jgi:hypothetical protein
MATEIGVNVWIEFYSCREHEGPCGLVLSFGGPMDDFSADHGTVPFATCSNQAGRPRWDVVLLDPLTLRPSIQTQGQKAHHGYITDGRWVSV